MDDHAGDQDRVPTLYLLLPLLLLLPPLLLLLARRRRIGGGPSSPRCGRRRRRLLPPSPPRLPLLGNLHQVGSCPHRSFASLSRVHGPVMLLYLGQCPTVVVSSAATAMEILKTHDLVFARRPQGEVAKKVFYGCTDVSFSPYGDHWKKLRKICALHLLGGRKARSYRLVREEEVSAMIEKVERHHDTHSSSPDRGVDVRELLRDFLNDLVTRVIHGRCFRESGRLSRVYSELMADHMALMTGFNLGEFFPSLGWLSLLTGLDRKASIIHRKWDRVLDDLIADHLRRRSPEDDEAAGELEETPFLDTLLALRDDPDNELSLTTDTIKSLLIDMLSAGTETAYITMEWAMAELVGNSDAMGRARAEIGRIVGTRGRAVGEADISGMSYLRAVLSETLRLHPPAPLLLPREASEDARVGGYDIPRQTTVMVNAWAIMRDPEFWDAPEEFRPERFLDSAAPDWQGGNFQFIPFGCGRRVCPGIQFAVPTMAMALANLLHRFDWELPPGVKELDMADKFEATTYRKHRLFLVPIPRQGSGGGGGSED